MNVFLRLCMMVFLLFYYVPWVLAVERDLEGGKALFKKHCVVCHGSEGKGDGYTLFNPPVADLSSPDIQKKTDFELWQSIHDGLPNTAMGTWKWVLSNAEAAHVLAYVRSLAR